MASYVDETDLATLACNAWANFSVACETLENHGSVVSEQPDPAALRSEMQRFQLWSINLGLFRQDHSSLDYRLRDNEIVRSFTKELLTSIVEALEEITSIASAGDEGSPSMISEKPKPEALKSEDGEPSSVRNDGGSSTNSLMMGALNDENESILILHFEDVVEAIDQLYNLASQVRSSKTRKTRTDIDLYKDVDVEIKSEYTKMRKRAELQGIEQVLLESRKMVVGSQTEGSDLVLTHEDQSLIQRLQKANHARRQQFEYWRRSKKRSIRAASKAIETIPSSKRHGERLIKILKHDKLTLVQPSEFARSSLSSLPALPKDFVLRSGRSMYSGTSRGLTVHGPSGEKVDWPKPPVAGPLKEDFECPFCFYFCAPRYHEDAAWRSHLKHDLRPYVCTYDDCTEPNVLYESWEEWTHHEQCAHQQRIWRCSEHPQHEYIELAAYEDHVRTYHTASMHQLLSSELLKSQESVSQVCDRPCPFCQCRFERPTDLQQHIAGHLESIALLSLPKPDDIDENSEAGKANSNSANRNYAESKAGDFDHTEPLIFPEDDHSGDTPVVTKMEIERFESKLNAESVSFESVNGVNVEARQAYSSELVRGWLSHLLRELAEDSEIYDSGSEEQTKGAVRALIAVAEKAQDIAAALQKFLAPLENQSAEITALMAECLATSLALRELNRKVGDFPYHRRYPEIAGDLTTVKDSLNYTFRDVERLFGGLGRVAVVPSAEYGYVWGDLCDFFRAESGNTLRRRLEIYCIVLEGLSYTMTEGLPPDPVDFEELLIKVEKLLDTQHGKFVEAFDEMMDRCWGSRSVVLLEEVSVTDLMQDDFVKVQGSRRSRPSVWRPKPVHREAIQTVHSRSKSQIGPPFN